MNHYVELMFVLCPVCSQNEVSDHSVLLYVRTYSCSFERCEERGPMKLECCICGKHYCNKHGRHVCIDPAKAQIMAKHEAAKELVNR